MQSREAIEKRYPVLFSPLSPFVYQKTLKEPSEGSLSGVYLARYTPTSGLKPYEVDKWWSNDQEMISAFAPDELTSPWLETLRPIVIKVGNVGKNKERDILLRLNKIFFPDQNARPVRLLCHGNIANNKEAHSFIGLEYVEDPYLPLGAYFERTKPLPLKDLLFLFKEITSFAYTLHKEGIDHGNLAGGENIDHLMWNPLEKKLRVLDWDSGEQDSGFTRLDQQDIYALLFYGLTGIECDNNFRQTFSQAYHGPLETELLNFFSKARQIKRLSHSTIIRESKSLYKNLLDLYTASENL